MSFIDTSWVLRVVAVTEIDYVFSLFTFEWGGKNKLRIRQAEKHTYKQTKTKNSVPVDIKWFS